MSVLEPFVYGQKLGQADLIDSALARRTGLGEYLGGAARQGFDDSLPGIALDRLRLGRAAVFDAAGTPNPAYGDPARLRALDPESPEATRGIDRETWDRLRGERELPYDPFDTEARARARIDLHDERAWRDRQIERRKAGLFDGTLGFVAGMAGSIPDPVNYIPLGGPALRAAWLAKAATRSAHVARAAGFSAAEATLGTALLEPLLVQHRAYLGDDMSAAEVMLDLAFGATLGAAFGGGHAALTTRGGRFVPGVAADPGKAMPEAGPRWGPGVPEPLDAARAALQPEQPAGRPAPVPDVPSAEVTADGRSVTVTPMPELSGPARQLEGDGPRLAGEAGPLRASGEPAPLVHPDEVHESAANLNQAVGDLVMHRPVELGGDGAGLRAPPAPHDPVQAATIARQAEAPPTHTAGPSLEAVLAFARSGPANEKLAADLGPVDPALADGINAKLRAAGIETDVSGFHHEVDNFAIRHARKGHSAIASELPRGQLPLSDADFLRIPEILRTPDAIETVGKTKVGRDAIGYWKVFEDGTVYYVEEIRTGRRRLAMTAMRKYKSRDGTPGRPDAGTGPQSHVRNALPGDTPKLGDPETIRKSVEPDYSPGAAPRDLDAEAKAELDEPEAPHLDPAAGTFPEEALYEAALEAGRIRPEDAKAVAAADAEARRLAGLDKAYEQAVACVIRENG